MSKTRTRRYTRKRPDWKPLFLKALATTGLVGRSAQLAGIDRVTAYRARNLKNRTGHNLVEAQRFAQAWDDALEVVGDRIELEIMRRALDGTEQPYDVYYKGEKVGTQFYRHYSDRLLIFLAKAFRPERYGAHWGDPATSEAEPDLLEATRQLAQERWQKLAPIVAERIALYKLNRESQNATPLNPPDPSQPPTGPNFPEDSTSA